MGLVEEYCTRGLFVLEVEDPINSLWERLFGGVL